MKKIALMLIGIAFIGMLTVEAQVRRISGTVVGAEDGRGIPGVSVVVRGTTLGTITNINGEYQLDVPNDAETLVFSFVGMQSQELSIEGNVINVTLSQDLVGIDEVVVVGYGTATRQSFVGSFTAVKNENIQSKAVSNLSQSLAGEAAGVRVINTSGQPGSSATVRIRGFGSVNGNRDPLYVLDGVPYSGSISSINPNDIESTTILKDATATAIYGSRGANGVILLTTKSGRVGTSVIEADVRTGVNVSGLPRYSTIKSPEDYIGLSWEALYNRGAAGGNANPVNYANNTLFSASGINPKYNLWNASGGDLIDPETRQVRSGVSRKYDPENWEDYGFQSSSRTEANLTFRGGSETTKYFSSVGYLNDVGYIINSDFKRYSATLNLESLVKPWLTTNSKMSYSGSETNNNGQTEDSGSVFWFVDNLPPIFPLFLRDGQSGEIVPDPIFGGNQYDYGVGRAFGALTNSIADAHFDRRNTKAHQLAGNLGATIRFTDNLSLENTFGAQLYMSKYNLLNNPFYGSSASQGGSVYKVDRLMTSYNFLNLLRYKNSFGVHSFEALAAHESNAWEEKVLTAFQSKMVHPDLDDLNNFVISSPSTSYTDLVRLESFFGQINYDYEKRYFLSSSIRRDGSSRFIGDNKWDTFGSLGLSWVVTNESFMASQNIFEYLKYKISYGIMGEQAGIGYYPGYITFDVNNLSDNISISERFVGNPDLSWETSKMFQTGIEFGIGRFLEGSIDYYVKNTENLLFDRRVGPSIGYALIQVNDGILRNSGLEFDLTTHFVNTSDYELNFSVNGEFLQSNLINMPIDPATEKPKVIDIAGYFGRAEGHSLFDFYLREWAGVDPADGTAMWFQYFYDENNNGVVDSGEGISSLYDYTHKNPDHEISKTVTKTYTNATQTYVGKSAIPTVRGAFRLDARVKGFDFGAQFIYSLGGYAYDFAYGILMHNDVIGGNNWHTDIFNRWQNPGDITDVPRLSSNYDTNVRSASTRFLTRSDFLSLNNVRLGYTVPANFTQRFSISSLNVFVSGDNLFLLSARDGFNPSTDEAGTTDTYRYSPLSTYTVGLRVQF